MYFHNTTNKTVICSEDSQSQIHTITSYLDMMIFPEYAKTRTDAKVLEGGSYI